MVRRAFFIFVCFLKGKELFGVLFVVRFQFCDFSGFEVEGPPYLVFIFTSISCVFYFVVLLY